MEERREEQENRENENLTAEEEQAKQAAKEPTAAQADEADKAQEVHGSEEAEAAEDAETPEEPEEAGTEDGSSDAPSGKKERKLKWARSKEPKEDPADAFHEKIKEANEKYTRLFAEFDNFRKRSDKEKAQRYDFGVKDTVEKILPVIDNFERGLAAIPEDKQEDSFVTGMQMIYKQLMKALEDIGVKPIEAVGQEFNPDFHNAVMHVDDPEAGSNVIVEEFQKGYMYKDHVVRYSMVKVAN